MPRGSWPDGPLPMASLSFQYLWHRIVLSSVEPALLVAARPRVGALTYGFEPVLDVHFSVERLENDRLALRDGPDLVGAYGTATAMLEELSLRVYGRAAEFASLRGWVRYRGTVRHDRSGRACVVVAGPGMAPLETEVLVSSDRSVVEVPPFSGTVVGTEGPITPEPIDALFVLEQAVGPVWSDALSPLVAARCLIEGSITVTESRGVIAAGAAGLANSMPVLRVRATSYDDAKNLVATLDVSAPMS
ncbi:MAG TPA: hypothetical protein VNG12_24645 [Acidimicrobiales bacterium]|nr:hypothetical protein [Acidimicrobiales bacterium]